MKEIPVVGMYPFVIIDLYTRQIINYELSNSRDTAFTIRCLARTFKKYGSPEITNSDSGCLGKQQTKFATSQGSRFTNNEYISLLKGNKLRINMDSVGRATDSARIERFFKSLMQVKLYIYKYSDLVTLKGLMKHYIKYYNNDRPHQSLK